MRYPLKSRRSQFLQEMEQVVPWAALVALIAPYAPVAGPRGGRPAFAVETMLRIYFLQHWYSLSDPQMQEELHKIESFRCFIRLDTCEQRIPDESTILRFRHLLERHELAKDILNTVNDLLCSKGLLLRDGTLVDTTIISAPSSTKNKTGRRDPETSSTKKGNQYYFGMKAHIGADLEPGAVHTVVATTAKVHDVTQAHKLLHGKEKYALGDAGYQGVEKRPEMRAAHPKVIWETAMRLGKRRALDKASALGQGREEFEQVKASFRAKSNTPFA